MLIGALQFDVRSDDADANFRAVEAGARAAADRGARLLVLPEMWPTSFPAAGGAPPRHEGIDDAYAATRCGLELLARLSAELELVLCGSAYSLPASPELAASELPANRFHAFESGAEVLAFDKVHLFTPTAEGEAFRAGSASPPVVRTSAGRLCGIVCYDVRFPELTRIPFHRGAELLVVPSQWPVTRQAHFRALAIGRAVENQCFVVATNRTGSVFLGRRQVELAFPGNSLVVGPAGHVLAEGRGEAGLVLAEIDLDEVQAMRRRVPVERDQRRDLYDAWRAE